MDYLDIVEVEFIQDAIEWLSEEDPNIGQVISIQLTGGDGPTPKSLRKAADSLDETCCGYNAGVFRIDGDLWFIGCDFGH